MRIRSLAVALLAGLALFISSAPRARAGDPILSASRLSVAIGVEREVVLKAPTDAEKNFGTVALAYNILSPDATSPHRPRVSITGRFSRSFADAGEVGGVVGLRLTLYNGGR